MKSREEILAEAAEPPPDWIEERLELDLGGPNPYVMEILVRATTGGYQLIMRETGIE